MNKDEFDGLFGEFVRHKRKLKNWTQADLAGKINNDFQNISRLERGEVGPSLFWINELSAAFGDNLGEFMTEFDAFVAEKQKEPSSKSH